MGLFGASGTILRLAHRSSGFPRLMLDARSIPISCHSYRVPFLQVLIERRRQNCKISRPLYIFANIQLKIPIETI